MTDDANPLQSARELDLENHPSERDGLYGELKPRHENVGSSSFLRGSGSERQVLLDEIDAHNSPPKLKVPEEDLKSNSTFSTTETASLNDVDSEVPELFEPEPTPYSAENGGVNKIGSPNYDPYAMTPWLKRRRGLDGSAESKAAKKRFLVFATTIILAAPGIAMLCAFSCVPNAPAIVATQIGVGMKNNSMILRAVNWGWPDPKYASGALLGLANQRVAQDKNAAMELYDEVLRLNPEFPNGYMNRALNWSNLGYPDKAHADFDKAIELNPKYALAYNNRGCLYMDENDYSKAMNDMNTAVRLDPRRADFYYNRALLYAKLGNRNLAAIDFDEAQMRTNDASLLKQIQSEREKL